MSTRRSGRAVAGATLAVIGLSMAVQTTAPSVAAALAPVDLVFAESAENSLASKSVDAVCPSGKVVLGGGGRVGWDDSGKVFLTRLVPYGN